MATEPHPAGLSVLGGLPATFTYTEALADGLTDRLLSRLRDSGEIEQISRGLYRRADAEPSADWNLLEIAHRAPRGTLCLASALARHGLTDLIPGAIDIAIPRGSTRPKIQAPVVWHHFAPETFEIGRSTTAVDQQTEIGIYSPERSIIDAFRLRRWEGPELGVTALRRWLRQPGSQPAPMLAMAASFPATLRPIRETLQLPVNANHPTRATVDGRTYLDLQNLARHDHRPTDEYVQFYALEGMLARLTSSDHADKFLLKGGALLAAYQARRPTRGIDLAATGLSNEAEAVLHIVREISQTPMDDGLTYDSGMADADIIRDEDQYSGVRVSLSGSLARARFTLHIDVNIGDPIWPVPSTIALPRLLGGQIVITGYPLAMVHAEKIVTAVERATANTRWRDFADIYLLSRKHPATGNELIRAITTVAEHRKAALLPLATTLRDFPPLAQNRWFAWRRQQDLAGAPADFADLLTAVIAFADPAITGGAKDKNWDAATSIWH